MEKISLAIPTDRKPVRTVRLCVLLGLTMLTLLVAVPGQDGSETVADPGAMTAPNG